MSALSPVQRLAYASGGLAMNLTNLVLSQWLFVLYVPDRAHALVPAGLFGLFFLLGRVTDAVTDPLIGYWSDRSRHPRGRRLPFIALGLAPFALAFLLLWTPPFAGADWRNGLYVALLLQAYFVLYTVVVTPYLALLPEIAHDPHERIHLTTLQGLFVTLGTLLFGGAGFLLAAGGWRLLGGAVAAITVLSFLPTLLLVRERPRVALPSGADGGGLVAWLGSTLANPPFRRLVAATSLYWFALNLLLLMVPFWTRKALGLGDDAVPSLMLPFLLLNVVFVLVFNHLARRFGKRRMFGISLTGSAVAFALVAGAGLLPFGDVALQSRVALALAGVPVAGFLMLPFALLADVVDQDAGRTGQRREAIYFGVQAIAQKTTIGLSILAFGALAYVGGGAEVGVTGLRLVALAAAAACAAGAVVFRGYRLGD